SDLTIMNLEDKYFFSCRNVVASLLIPVKSSLLRATTFPNFSQFYSPFEPSLVFTSISVFVLVEGFRFTSRWFLRSSRSSVLLSFKLISRMNNMVLQSVNLHYLVYSHIMLT